MTENILVTNGALIPTAQNVDECKTACLNNKDCTGIDYHLNPVTGSPAVDKRCYILGRSAGAKKTANNVKHYDLARNCFPKGQKNGH